MLNPVFWKANSNTQSVELDNTPNIIRIYLFWGSMHETNQQSCQFSTKGVVEKRRGQVTSMVVTIISFV